MARDPFPVRLLHSRLPAGLSRRTDFIHARGIAPRICQALTGHARDLHPSGFGLVGRPHEHHRRQGPPGRGGPSRRVLTPLALGLAPTGGAGVVDGRLQGPAPEDVRRWAGARRAVRRVLQAHDSRPSAGAPRADPRDPSRPDPRGAGPAGRFRRPSAPRSPPSRAAWRRSRPAHGVAAAAPAGGAGQAAWVDVAGPAHRTPRRGAHGG
jgi:hypothetical protein